MKNCLFFLLLGFLLTACKSESNSSSGAETTSMKDGFVIQPGVGFGAFEGEMTKSDLMSLVDRKELAERDFYLGEGETMPGLVLYPDSPEEVEVLLDDDGYAILYRLTKAGSKWKTQNGLMIGSSLTDLEKANGKPFKLMGFDWDYGGTVTNWQGGTFDGKDFLVVLGYDPEETQIAEEDYQHLAGDQEIMSNSPAMQRYSFEIVEILQRY